MMAERTTVRLVVYPAPDEDKHPMIWTRRYPFAHLPREGDRIEVMNGVDIEVQGVSWDLDGNAQVVLRSIMIDPSEADEDRFLGPNKSQWRRAWRVEQDGPLYQRLSNCGWRYKDS